MRDDEQYSRSLIARWRAGEGFVVVEHDIVPWPGALSAMKDCEALWCGYQYPASTPLVLGGTLGCTRFSTDLIQRCPDLCEGWHGIPWQDLDGRVIVDIEQAVGGRHFHNPPVAHARTMAYVDPTQWLEQPPESMWDLHEAERKTTQILDNAARRDE